MAILGLSAVSGNRKGRSMKKIKEVGYAAAAKATTAMGRASRAIEREKDRALSGEVSVEWVLIAALVAIGLIGGLMVLASNLDGKLNVISKALESADTITPQPGA